MGHLESVERYLLSPNGPPPCFLRQCSYEALFKETDMMNIKDSELTTKEHDGQHCFDDKINSNILKSFFSNMATELVKKLPDPPCKFGIDSVKTYYKNLNLGKKNSHFTM